MKWFYRRINVEIYCQRAMETLSSHLCVIGRDILASRETGQVCLDGGGERIFSTNQREKCNNF